MHTHDLTPTATVVRLAEPARRTTARRHHVIRIATIGAIAALSIGASAATASARPCSCDDDAAQDVQITQAWIQTQRHLLKETASRSTKGKWPPHPRYHGRH
jgi:hypothetical protein